jgi:hypothetical protein
MGCGELTPVEWSLWWQGANSETDLNLADFFVWEDAVQL